MNSSSPTDAILRIQYLIWLCLIGLWLIWSNPSQAADEPADLLARMAMAVEQLNYRGVLVHTYRGEADVSQIVHRVADGMVTERMTAMDDAGREIIRSNGKVTCIFPDQRMIMVEHQLGHSRDASAVVGQLPNFVIFDDANYDISMLGEGRVSMRDATVLSVTPTDGFRYGYRLWVDQATAMLLKSQLLDEREQVVEEFLFTEVSFPDSIPAADVQPTIDIDSFTWDRPEPAVNEKKHPGDADWHAMELPSGFVLAAVQSKNAAGARGYMEQLVYSDGLASVSVFVEMGVAAAEQAEGLSTIGAANAYTTTMQGRLITAVGDVPERTAKMIALSVRPSGEFE